MHVNDTVERRTHEFMEQVEKDLMALPQFERNHFAKVLEARAAEWRQCDAANPLPALWPIRIQVLGLLNTVRARSRRRRD